MKRFLICLTVILLATFLYVGFVVNRDITNTYGQVIKGLDTNIENYFQTINTFSKDLITSDVFVQTSIVDLPKHYEANESTTSDFSALFQVAYEMYLNEYNVGIAVNNDYYIWLGDRFGLESTKDYSKNRYTDFVRNEHPSVFALENNSYLELFPVEFQQKESFIVLARSMDHRNKFLDGSAILEVLIPKSIFDAKMENLTVSNSVHIKMSIYDKHGNLLYTEDDDSTQYVSTTSGRFIKDGDYYFVNQLFENNITTVYSISLASYYRNFLYFLLVSIALYIVTIIIIMNVTNKISAQMSEPINIMCKNVENIDLQKHKNFIPIQTDIEELNFLSKTIENLGAQLDVSLEKIISLKNYEVQAKMIALQAQMQPHFLYNTLSAMGSLATTGNTQAVSQMCTSLTKMFRYIVAEEKSGIKLFEEITHTQNYIEIMKERFTNTEVTIDIPLELYDCVVPKLIVQPLVENSFKYCNRNKPQITIIGTISLNGKWTICIKDNGDGFSKEKIIEIMQLCKNGLREDAVFSNTIDGMGLVNVYVRLYLYYGENMIFEITENEGTVTIGGTAHEST